MKLVSDTWGCSSVFFRLKKNAAISEQEEDRQTNQFVSLTAADIQRHIIN